MRCTVELAASLLLLLPLCVLSAGRAEQGSGLTLPFTDVTNCPGWLMGYVDWHKQHRGAAGARYLVVSCQKHKHWCGGTGDRFRGFKFALKLAYATDRVLLISDREPIPLETILAPHLINWTLDGINITRDAGSYKEVFLYMDETIEKGLPLDLPRFQAATRFMFLFTNFAEDVGVGASFAKGAAFDASLAGDNILNAGAAPGAAKLWPASCLWRVLFKPTPELLELYRSTLRSVFGAPAPRYAAIHLRAGGMAPGNGETQAVKRADDNLLALVRALACARKEAASRNLSAPILLLTDNHALRHAVQRGILGAGVVSTHFPVVHLDWTGHAQAVRAIFVDLLLLAGAQCLVLPTRSGFSNQANMLSASDCYVPWTAECMKAPLEAATISMFNLPPTWPGKPDKGR